MLPTPFKECGESYDEEREMVKPEMFMSCLKVYLSNRFGSSAKNSLVLNDDGDKILGFKQSVGIINIESTSTTGVQMLLETREVFETGPGKTYAFSSLYFGYETYVIFFKEA